jgi:hypothetical protein
MVDPDVEKTREDLNMWVTRLERTVADLYKEIDRARTDGDSDGQNSRT